MVRLVSGMAPKAAGPFANPHSTPAMKISRVQARQCHWRRDMSEIVIAVEGLGKKVSDAIGTLTILEDITFTVRAGETVAIVGASGSGKSTLLGLIAGLDQPTSGSVQLAGENIGLLDEDGRALLRARRVGFVFQSFQLLPHLSALENVMLPLELQGLREARSRSVEILGKVGLGERLNHYPKTLSGGEQQRVALARAFVAAPQVLLADEPTGSLDAATGAGIMDLVFELNQSRGSTLVLVTHDPVIAARCAARVTLAAGRITDMVNLGTVASAAAPH
jgi:putative ABC transport system ATP-binding protein